MISSEEIFDSPPYSTRDANDFDNPLILELVPRCVDEYVGVTERNVIIPSVLPATIESSSLLLGGHCDRFER